ncbi:MAG: helix-turn-helix domain-containing protein [Hyphomicrobiaceae bacterium]
MLQFHWSETSSAPAGDLAEGGGDASVNLRQLIDCVVASTFNIDFGSIAGPTRGQARIALARQIAMYLAHVVFGLALTDVGRLFHRDRTTVRHACAIIEDRRDDKTFDHMISRLEQIVLHCAVKMGISVSHLVAL